MIKNRKKAINTNCISPNKPSPDAIVKVVSRTNVTKNDMTAESLSPIPEAKSADKISIKDGNTKKIETPIIKNNTANAIKIFLDSFLSLRSDFPIMVFILVQF